MFRPIRRKAPSKNSQLRRKRKRVGYAEVVNFLPHGKLDISELQHFWSLDVVDQMYPPPINLCQIHNQHTFSVKFATCLDVNKSQNSSTPRSTRLVVHRKFVGFSIQARALHFNVEYYVFLNRHTSIKTLNWQIKCKVLYHSLFSGLIPLSVCNNFA